MKGQFVIRLEFFQSKNNNMKIHSAWPGQKWVWNSNALPDHPTWLENWMQKLMEMLCGVFLNIAYPGKNVMCFEFALQNIVSVEGEIDLPHVVWLCNWWKQSNNFWVWKIRLISMWFSIFLNLLLKTPSSLAGIKCGNAARKPPTLQNWWVIFDTSYIAKDDSLFIYIIGF